jgi:mannose-1-phosphate guanylyltransferase
MNATPWSVLLAGGDGLRVSEFTRQGDGTPTPKQYCRLGGRPPMIRWALDRARRVAPDGRILVVVNEAHRRFWEADLADLPRQNILEQPANRGTAAGVLLALLTVEARNRAASPVVFLPSDHYIEDEATLNGAIQDGVDAVRGAAEVVLLGMTPSEHDQECGWIVPGDGSPIASVRQFVEKPPADQSAKLMLLGGLINSFVFVARSAAMLALFERALPDLTDAFRTRVRPLVGVTGLTELYERITPADLSRDVLQRMPSALGVVPVPPCGWSDLGTPARLQRFLGQTAVVAA